MDTRAHAHMDTHIEMLWIDGAPGLQEIVLTIMQVFKHIIFPMSPSSSLIPLNGAPPRRIARANPLSSVLRPKPGSPVSILEAKDTMRKVLSERSSEISS